MEKTFLVLVEGGRLIFRFRFSLYFNLSRGEFCYEAQAAINYSGRVNMENTCLDETTTRIEVCGTLSQSDNRRYKDLWS